MKKIEALANIPAVGSGVRVRKGAEADIIYQKTISSLGDDLLF